MTEPRGPGGIQGCPCPQQWQHVPWLHLGRGRNSQLPGKSLPQTALFLPAWTSLRPVLENWGRLEVEAGFPGLTALPHGSPARGMDLLSGLGAVNSLPAELYLT